jgi:uncharacterized repeat protein (TIGR01451 family)
MLFNAWRRWINPGKSTLIKNQRRERDRLGRERYRPNVEGLEIRIVPAVTLTKTAASPTAIAGQNITYTIQVQSDLDDFVAMLDDTLPAGTTFVSGSQNPADPTQWTPNFPPVGTNNNVIWSTVSPGNPSGFLPANEIDTFTLVAQVDPAASSGNITNSVRYTSLFVAAPGTAATAAVAVNSTADVAVTKTASPSPVTAGTDITYSVTVTNNGPGSADNVSMTDAVPAGATFVSETQVSGPTFNVTNPGVGGTGNTTATITSLAANATAVFQIVDHVLSSTPDGSNVSDTADVTTTSNDPNAGNNLATVSTPVAAVADLAITKTGPATATAGTDLTYTLTLTNLGPSDSQSPLLIDAVPTNTTFVSVTQQSGATTFGFTKPPVGGTGFVIGSATTLPASETDIFVLVVNINSSAPDGSTIANTANISSGTTDPNSANDSSTALTTVAAVADLSVTKTAPVTVTAGTDLTYTLSLTDLGPSDAQNVNLADTLPANTTFVSATAPGNFSTTAPNPGQTGTVTFSAPTVVAGENDTFTIVVRIAPSAADGSSINNTTTVTSSTTDSNAGNNTATATSLVTTVADLAVTKTAPATVTAGANATYTITLTNAGPSDAQTVALNDALPANTTFVSDTQTSGPAFNLTSPPVGSGGTVTATTATFAATGTATFEIVVHIAASTASGTTISNTATAGAATTDPNAANNSSTATSTVATSADLAVTKTGPPVATAGTDITYTITLTNNGPSDAQSAVLSDTPPPGTTLVSFTQISGPPSGGTLPANGTETFSLVLHVNSNVAQSTTLTNTATASSTTPDPNSANNSSSVNTTVVTVADLAATKTAPATVTAGTNLTYTISVTNSGPSDAQSVAVTDVIPGNTTFVSETQTSGPAFILTTPPAGGTGTVSDTIASLAAGASATFTLVLAVNASAPNASTINNTATIGSTTADSNPANNSSTTATTVATAADLSVTKTGPAAVTAGTDLTYTLSVTNGGPSDAQTVVVSDIVPTGATFVSAAQTSGPAFQSNTPAPGSTGTVTFLDATFAAGASATFTIVVHANSSDANGSTISNTANISSNTTDTNNANNTSTVNTTVTAVADVAVTKTGPATALAGNQVTYTLVVSNTGPSDAQGVNLTDTLPAGETFVSASQGSGSGTAFTAPLGAVAAGSSTTITLVAQISPSVPNGTTLTDSATVTSTTTDTNAANNTATFATTVNAAADVAITKTGPATATAGTQVTYTLSVSNTGPSDAQGVTVSDTLPAGETFVSSSSGTGSGTSFTDTLGTVAAGASTTITIVAQISPSVANGTTLTDSATVTSTTTDTNAANNTATFNTTASAVADLRITKTGPATATAGTQVTYTLSVTNGGPSDAQAVNLSDTLPAGETFVSASSGTGSGTSFTDTLGTLAAGASTTVTLVAQVSPSVANGAVLTNSATVTSTTTDNNAANNTATLATTVATSADLSVTKTGPATVTAGTNLTYTITLTNAGPSDAQNISLTDDTPTGTTFVSETHPAGFTSFTPAPGGTGAVTETAPTLAAGATATFTIVVHANSSNAGGATITNTASATSTTPDANAANNTSSVTATVAASADLAVTKTGPATVTAGTNLTYTITLTNAGPSDAATVTLTDATPTGTTFVSETHSAGFTSTTPAVGGTGMITQSAASLAAGATATFTIVVKAAAGTAAGSTITNTATGATTTTDPNSANNSSTVTTTVAAASADLAITKTGPATATQGTSVTYTLTVTNNGPSDAGSVVVTDTLPAGATLDSFTFSQGSQGTGAASNTFNLGTVAAGATVTGTIVLTLNSAGTSTDTASVSAATGDSNAANNTSSFTTTVTASTINGTAVPVTGFEKSALNNVQVAIFTSGNGTAPASDFTATIDWGDGTSSAGTVTSNNGSYSVTGTHTYNDEKVFPLIVTISGNGASTTVNTTANILEELLFNGGRGTADQRWLSEVYRDMLGRPIDGAGLATFTAELNAGVSRFQVVQNIQNAPTLEYRAVEVQALYQQYLHRAADASGLTTWENFLQSGGTVEQVAVNLVTSPEFNQTQAGPTNDTWLDAFYNDALGRAVDASGRSTWDTAFANGATRAQVAASIFTSTEYHQDLVKQYYNQFLDRVVDGSGYPAWTNTLNSGIHDELVIASIVGSPEFYDKTSA